MGGDARRAKCCCVCDWPVISTTSAHLLSHIPTDSYGDPRVYNPGGVVTLTTPSGTLPTGEFTFYNDYTNSIAQNQANHWHATPRNDLASIQPGDRAGWWGSNTGTYPGYFKVYRHVLLGAELTCQELHTIWDASGLDSSYVGIPQDTRVFWCRASSSSISLDRFAVVFFDSTWDNYTYGSIYRHRLFMEDTMCWAAEYYFSTPDTYESPYEAITYVSASFCICMCTPGEYMTLIHNIQ